MIYLENNNGTQQIFIPKNLNISINKTYDEGFQDGMNYQKEKLEVLNVTENGVYKSDNGYKQVNVEVGNENVCKLEELNIAIVNDIEEYTATDSNLDGFSKVNVDATEFGENRYNLGYEQGYEQGKSDVGCNVGFKYHIVKDEHETINSSEFGYDGFNEVEIDASEFGNKKYEEGYEQGKSEGGEGGSCNLSRLEEQLDANDDGHIVRFAIDYGVDGWDYLDLDVNQYGNRKYEEGYNQGKSECGEGGECPELTELNVVENGTYEGSFNKVNVTVNATDFSSEQVENTYPYIAFEAINLRDIYGSPIIDKEKFGSNTVSSIKSNDLVSITTETRTVALSTKNINYDNDIPSVVAIERGAIDWNKVDIFKSYTIKSFGENMTRDTGSNLRVLYISLLDEQISSNHLYYFNEGSFATCNRLSKIVIAKPDILLQGNPTCFEGVSSWGQVIVVGEETDERRNGLTQFLMPYLPSDWKLIFDPSYE